jgi:hypothetical protein
MQVEQATAVEVDSSTYHYEDYLADMGNAASSEGVDPAAGPPMETEATHIGRLQAITGAKGVETKVKPRGPKAEPADHAVILVRPQHTARSWVWTQLAAGCGADDGLSTDSLAAGVVACEQSAQGPSSSTRSSSSTQHTRQPPACPCPPARVCVLHTQAALSKLLLFDRMGDAAQAKVADNMWTRRVGAGEILIQEGETGLAASELYVVKDGSFEVRGGW